MKQFNLLLLVSFAFIFFSALLSNIFTKFIVITLILSLLIFYFYAHKKEYINTCSNILLTIISIHFTFIIFEIILRISFPQLVWYRPHDMLIERSPDNKFVRTYSKKKQITFNTFGNLVAMSNKSETAVHRDVLFSTDKYGFRNNKFYPDNSYDIVLLGDSFVAGVGTHQEKIFSNKLENISNKTVYNLGIPGNIYHSYLNLYYHLPRLKNREKTDLYLFFFSGNDLEEDYIIVDPSSYTSLERWFNKIKNIRKNSVLGRLLYRFIYGRPSYYRESKVRERKIEGNSVLFYEPYETSWKKGIKNNKISDNLDELYYSISKIKLIADKYFKNFVMFYVPTKIEVYQWYFKENKAKDTWKNKMIIKDLLQEYCDKEEIEYFDLSVQLISYAMDNIKNSNKLLYWRDDTHFSDIGHHMVANFLASQWEK